MYVRHCNTELRKHVFPMLASPDPIPCGEGHFILTKEGSYSTCFGAGIPSLESKWLPSETAVPRLDPAGGVSTFCSGILGLSGR